MYARLAGSDREEATAERANPFRHRHLSLQSSQRNVFSLSLSFSTHTTKLYIYGLATHSTGQKKNKIPILACVYGCGSMEYEIAMQSQITYKKHGTWKITKEKC